MVDSLITLQARTFSEAPVRRSFLALRTRIYTLGLVHHQLMSSNDLRTFDIAPFLTELTTHLTDGAASRNITLSIDAQALSVGLDFAIPLGLLVTELVTNAIKHAFEGRPGAIDVTLTHQPGGTTILRVSDNGTAQDVEREGVMGTAPGIGFSIIEALVAQLRGTMNVQRAGGTSTTIQLPSPVQP